MTCPSDSKQLKPSWRMVWQGRVFPYVRTTQRAKFANPRYRLYTKFKKAFRLIADTYGMIQSLEHGKRYWLSICIRVKGHCRYDIDNACKSISDSLFEQDNGVKTLWASVEENAKDEDCVVELYEM